MKPPFLFPGLAGDTPTPCRKTSACRECTPARLTPLVLFLLAIVALHQTACAQLAITEVMASSTNRFGTTVVTNGPDYWELSNFSDRDLPLADYRFNDSDGGLNQGHFLPNIVIKPNESIIFFEGDISVDGFRAWWGLGTNVQVIPYPSTGYGLAATGDSVLLWGPTAVDDLDLVDAVTFGEATTGHSSTYDTATGRWGVPSTLNVDGAFRAATSDDIGSPGTNPGPVPLRIIEHPVSTIANAGDSVSFTVLYEGVPRPHFQWFHDGTPISGAHQATLLVTNALSTDAGAYFVVLSNSFLSVTSHPATLTLSTVPVLPSFIESPTELWIFPDQHANFHCVATGLPRPTYQWRRDGQDLIGETRSALDVQPPHAVGTNIYSVVASNSLGAITNEVRLLAFERPDLRITELMPWASASGEDWWELTNFGTNAVDLFGYRFDDFTLINATDGGAASQPRLQYAWILTNHVVIQPRESIVFTENLTAQQFIQWWGWTNVPPSLQIITYSGGGLSFSQTDTDGLGLWNMGARSDDDFVHPFFGSAAYSPNDIRMGVSLTIDPEFPDDGCCYLPSEAGIDGAFIASLGGDIGSPGYIRAPTDPRIISLSREASGWRLTWRTPLEGVCRVQVRSSIGAGGWTSLATIETTAGSTTTYLDTSTNLQRFYRVIQDR
jgi:hypothetical protein